MLDRQAWPASEGYTVTSFAAAVGEDVKSSVD